MCLATVQPKNTAWTNSLWTLLRDHSVRPNLHSTLLVECLEIGEPVEKESTEHERALKKTPQTQKKDTQTVLGLWKDDTTPRARVRSDPCWRQDTQNMRFTSTHTWCRRRSTVWRQNWTHVRRCCMKDHIKSQTQKTSAQPLNQHLSAFARNHAHTRNGNIPGDMDVMGQHWLENHDALFWINPFVWPRIPTHWRHNVSEISDTRGNMTTTTTKTHFEGTACKIGHDAVSWYIPPVSVPNQKQPKPERVSLSKETTRTAQNNLNTPSKTPTTSQPRKQTTSPCHNTTCNWPSHATPQRLPQIDAHRVGLVYSAREQDSSVREDARFDCLGVLHMEEGVQDRVQVEVGREELGEGETHGESQNEETTRNKRSTAHHGWHGDGVTCACSHLSHVVWFTRVQCAWEKWRVKCICLHSRRLQWIAIDCKRNQL